MEHTSNEKELKGDSYGSCGEDVCVDRGNKTGGVTSVLADIEGPSEEMDRLVRKIDKCLLSFMVRMREGDRHSTSTVTYYLCY